MVLNKILLERRLRREQLEVEHEHEQRRALQALVAKHHGLLLECATSWHFRMLNIYDNVGRGWLTLREGWQGLAEDTKGAQYYYKSTIYRFLALIASAQRFENEQIYLDARYAGKHELDFVKFVKAFHWVLSDVSLFRGLPYDDDTGPDHFFSDDLRAIAGSQLQCDQVPTYRTFEERLRTRATIDELPHVFQFFDGLNPAEDRLRWDRLICLDLITIAFLSQFGYEWQKPSEEQMRQASERLNHPEIGVNLIGWLPRLGLDKTEYGKRMQRVVSSAPAIAALIDNSSAPA